MDFEFYKRVKEIETEFESSLLKELNLVKINGPLITLSSFKMNDYLDGTTKPIEFTNYQGTQYEIVQSLAKWKRIFLNSVDAEDQGICVEMNAIRPCEHLDATHSIHVRQWDWEFPLVHQRRRIFTLVNFVKRIYKCIRNIAQKYNHQLYEMLPENIYFIHSTELKGKDSKEKERIICKEHKAVCIIGIGGGKHDSRSPEYDDYSSEYSGEEWKYLRTQIPYQITDPSTHCGLNCDILVWNPILNDSLELSSMGIRVTKDVLLKQLKGANLRFDKSSLYQKQIIEGDCKKTIGGGIGISRLIMWILQLEKINDLE